MSKKITKNQLKSIVSYAKANALKPVEIPYHLSDAESDIITVKVDCNLSMEDVEEILASVVEAVFHDGEYFPARFEPAFFASFASHATDLQFPEINAGTNWHEVTELYTALNFEFLLEEYGTVEHVERYYALKENCEAMVAYRKECYSHNANTFNMILDLVKKFGASLADFSKEFDVKQLQEVAQQMQNLINDGVDAEKIMAAYGAYLNHPQYVEENETVEPTPKVNLAPLESIEDQLARLEQAKAKLALLGRSKPD